MKRGGLLLVLLFLVSISSVAQSLLGQVFDNQTGKPLANASVFIANTTKGASTDRDGKFEIGGLYNIHYNLVVSYLGYKPVVVDLVAGSPIVYQIRLTPVSKVLKEVVVRSITEAQWRKYLVEFKDHFIGHSENAKWCSIENENALEFSKKNNVLKASSDSTIIMKNLGLGFRVKIMIDVYEYDSKLNTVLYEGHLSYEPLVPVNEKQKMKWAQNRLTAYYGSEMHFFRALYNHKLNQEGFFFSFEKRSGNDSLALVHVPALGLQLELRTITNYDWIVTVNKSGEDVLDFDDWLTITYTGEVEEYAYQKSRRLRPKTSLQKSILKSNQPAYVYPDGRVWPIEGAEAGEYWSWELMSEELPLDYDPSEDLLILHRTH